jgi:DNA ligase-1
MYSTTWEIYKIFHDLSTLSSRLDKETILKHYSNNFEFKEILKFLIDPMVVTGISTKKLNKILHFNELSCVNILQMLDYLKEHNTGTDSDISFVQSCIKTLSTKKDVPLAYQNSVKEFLENLVTKSFRCGVTSVTANKLYGDSFIPKLNVMLGTSIEQCNVPEDSWISISRKLNGVRCFFYQGALYSRQGKLFTDCQHIVKDLTNLSNIYTNYVFDGELLLQESGLSDSDNFQKGTGIANSKTLDKSSLKLVLFDLLPEVEFEKGKSSVLYQERKRELNKIRQLMLNNHWNSLDVVEFLYEGYDTNKIEDCLKYAEQHDWEGVMVNLNSPYECKRTKNLIKVKKFFTYDLRVVDVEKGTGRNQNRVGKLIVDFKGNKVGVGSGLSDKQRDCFWLHPEMIIGRVVEVKYKEVTRNKNGTESLQFPTLVSIREEGKEPSFN